MSRADAAPGEGTLRLANTLPAAAGPAWLIAAGNSVIVVPS